MNNINPADILKGLGGADLGELGELIGKLKENKEIQDILSSMTRKQDHVESVPLTASEQGDNSGEGEVYDEHLPQTKVQNSDSSSLDNLTRLLSPEMLGIIPKLSSLLNEGGGGKESAKKDNANRNALLCALRPYLTDKRRKALELMIGMGNLGIFDRNTEAKKD